MSKLLPTPRWRSIIALLLAMLAASGSTRAELWFSSTNEWVDLRWAGQWSTNQYEWVIADDPEHGRLSVRDPAAAFFEIRNPNHSTAVSIESIASSSPDLKVEHRPHGLILPYQSGPLVLRARPGFRGTARIAVRSVQIFFVTNTQFISVSALPAPSPLPKIQPPLHTHP